MTSAVPSIAETSPEAGVLRWTLCNEARRNAIDPDGLRWIATRCDSLRGEIVVLTGAGDRSFCAGFDLTALHPSEGSLPDEPLIEAAQAMTRADATFVAAVNGYAIGAGVELCCACDLRLATSDATFSIPAARLGVVYHAEGLARIRGVFGPAMTRKLFLLGRKVTAAEALRAGALLDVVERDAVPAALEALLADLRAGLADSIRGNRTMLRLLDVGVVSEDARRSHEELRRSAYAKLNPPRR